MAKRDGPLILKRAAGRRAVPSSQLTLLPVISTPWWNSRVDRSIPYWNLSLALGAEGNAHIAYHDYSDGNLKYASESGGSWTVENLDSTEQTGQFASLALDTKSNPHIAYSYSFGGGHYSRLKYASKGGGIWTVETVDGSPGCYAGWLYVHVGWFASLALDAEDNPHIAYYDNSAIGEGKNAHSLKYASKSRGIWTVETVDSVGDVGKYASLALDANGNPQISYTYTYSEGRYSRLKYASKNGGKWTIEDVATPGSDEWNRYYISLALDAGDDPHIAYYEMTQWMHQGTLKYARRSSGIWTVETVDSVGNVGEHTSLTLDAKGNPHIAYYDATNRHLKYASKNGGNWTVETVDSTELVGWFTSLALDTYNNPRIAYYDATNLYVKYASAAVELNSPGSEWKVGASRTVTWQGTGTVDLLISSDGGTTWTLLASGLAGGSHSLRAPNLPTKSAKLKLVRAMPYSVTTTTGFFTIAP